MRIRVLQLNLWARYGPYAEREPRLKRLFAEAAPDLIALQEVDAGPGDGNQAADLLEALGYEVAYARREGRNRGDPGIAVASRHPILARQVKELPYDDVAIAARVKVRDESLWFCSAATSWLPGDERQREVQCVAIDDWLGSLADDGEIPPILAGDFNATPDAACIRFLTGLQSLDGRSTYWADAWALAGDGSPGHTWTSESPYVAPFSEAALAEPVHHRRIDYVFVGSPIRWKPRIVMRSCRVVGRFESGAAPSDHYGVLADLQLDGDLVGRGRGHEAWDETKKAFGWD